MKKGWTYKKLGEVFSSINNGANIKQIKGATGIPITRIETLSNDKFNRDRMGFANIENVTPFASYVLNEGDILMSHINSMKFLGRSVAYSKMGDETIIHGMNLLRLVPTTNVLSPFMIYQFQTRYFKDQILQISHQSVNQASFNITNLKGLNIMVPPLAEQERIVEQLDAAFAQIDELKSNAERQLAEARALFQAALTQAMQPKPGWQEKKLVNVCDIFGRIGFRGYTTKDLVSSQNDGAISLSPSNIQNGEMDYSKRTYISWFKYNESPEIKIFNGDILLVKTGSSYGKSALVKNLPHEATINPQSVVLKNFRINNEFFAYQLRTERVKKEFDQFVSGTAIPTFSQAKLGIVPIYFPGEIEQIVSYLNSINNLVKELEEINRKTATECDALKQALLRQIFE